MAEVAILVIGLLINGIGILGCIIPALPGPLISWLSLFLFFFLPDYEVGTWTLVISGILMAIVSALDYVIPVLGAKKFGSSREGVIGGVLGVFAGILLTPVISPIAIVLGPLVGTIAGDLLAGGTFKKALNSGMGSLLGFVVGTSIKLLYSTAVLIVFCFIAWDAISKLFI